MEAVDRRRGHVLLDHAPRDPFSGEEMKQRGATDFGDVFGGPPRRFSLCDNRSSLGGSGDDSEPVGMLDRDDSAEGGQLWASSFVEKPVFGGFGSPAHRRHLGDDFFNDIFRGNESPSSTPRRLDRDGLTFSPNSSFLSPSRPLPPATDVFSGDSGSKAPNLSYSSRLAKTFDYSPHKSLTARTTEKVDRSANSSVNSPSRFTSPKAPPNHRDEIKKSEYPPMKEEFSSKIGSDHNLHFSMYKWASKGVTLVIPPNLKERIKGRSRLGGVYAQVSQEPDLPSDKENLPQGAPIFQSPDEPEDKSLTLYLNPPVENNKTPEVLRDITEQSDDAGFSVETRKLKNLRHLINDEHEIEEKEVPVVDSKKATRGTREDTNLHRLPRPMSKVKESVKNIESRGGGNGESTETKVEEHRPVSKMVNEDGNKVKYQASAIPIAPKFQAERPLSDIPGIQRVVGSAPMTFLDSRNSIDVSFCEIDVTDFENDEDYMLEDLSQECNEVTEASSQEEEIRNSDAKIREWSKGRQGNIRSLLSTLQYVLWPECGWKPVRLVDIIEGPSVRRAYQRALLYLHPDKLQQKGADMHHKYVAEKVFAILQVAWDQFNSLGAI